MSGKYDPNTDERVVAERAAKERQGRILEKVIERRRWAELARTYERCIQIADSMWGAQLEDASRQQQALAEAMRDRGSVHVTPAEDEASSYGESSGDQMAFFDHGIPVPLFTPRDRVQFLKEAAVALLIESGKRGLTVTPEVKEPDAPQKADEAQPHEAGSGVDETDGDAPLALATDQQEASGLGVPEAT